MKRSLSVIFQSYFTSNAFNDFVLVVLPSQLIDVPANVVGGKNPANVLETGLMRLSGICIFAKAVRPVPSGFPVIGS